MTIRKGSQRLGSLDAALAELPAELYRPVVSVDQGQMTGLAGYMRDLAEHLGSRGVDTAEVVPAMTALGIPPAAWYRAALGSI